METNIALISYCSVYQGYEKGRCPGFAGNEKARWCKVRSCNIERDLTSCSDCDQFSDVSDCKKFNNFISKVFALLWNSDRRKGILYIKSNRSDAFAEKMISLNRVSIKLSD